MRESGHTTKKERKKKMKTMKMSRSYFTAFEISYVFLLPALWSSEGASGVEDSFMGLARCYGHLVTRCLFLKHL